NGVAVPAAATTLPSGLDYPDFITIDNNNIYWIEQGPTITTTTSHYKTNTARAVTDFMFDFTSEHFGGFTSTCAQYQELNWITAIVHAPTSKLGQMPLNGGPITYLDLAGGTPVFGHPNGSVMRRTIIGTIIGGPEAGDNVEESVVVTDNSIGTN